MATHWSPSCRLRGAGCHLDTLRIASVSVRLNFNSFRRARVVTPKVNRAGVAGD